MYGPGPRLSFIFAAGCPTRYSSLPPGNGRAILDCRYIWPCNPQDVRRRQSPGVPVGSYPAFSPLPPAETSGGRFLSHYPRHRCRLSVKKCGALCCPDFPLRLGGGATDRASAYVFVSGYAEPGCKVT